MFALIPQPLEFEPTIRTVCENWNSELLSTLQDFLSLCAIGLDQQPDFSFRKMTFIIAFFQFSTKTIKWLGPW